MKKKYLSSLLLREYDNLVKIYSISPPKVLNDLGFDILDKKPAEFAILPLISGERVILCAGKYNKFYGGRVIFFISRKNNPFCLQKTNGKILSIESHSSLKDGFLAEGILTPNFELLLTDCRIHKANPPSLTGVSLKNCCYKERRKILRLRISPRIDRCKILSCFFLQDLVEKGIPEKFFQESNKVLLISCGWIEQYTMKDNLKLLRLLFKAKTRTEKKEDSKITEKELEKIRNFFQNMNSETWNSCSLIIKKKLLTHFREENNLDILKKIAKLEKDHLERISQIDKVTKSTTLRKKMVSNNIEIFTDGGARPNPGITGAGVVILQDENLIFTGSYPCGHGTNNQAEWEALILSIIWMVKHQMTFAVVSSDSNLVVKQMNGEWKIKDKVLKKKKAQIDRLLTSNSITIEMRWVKAHSCHKWNNLADDLAGKAIKSGEVQELNYPREVEII